MADKTIYGEKWIDALTIGITGSKSYGIAYRHNTSCIVWFTTPTWHHSSDTKTYRLKTYDKTGANYNMAAKTGYKVINVKSDAGAVFWYGSGQNSQYKTDGRTSSSQLPAQPEHVAGITGVSNWNNALTITKVYVPNHVSTAKLQAWFDNLDTNRGFAPPYWLYPSSRYSTDITTAPIYFNDFYHQRTPLYKDGL